MISMSQSLLLKNVQFVIANEVKQSHNPLIIKEIAPAHMRLAMTGKKMFHIRSMRAVITPMIHDHFARLIRSGYGSVKLCIFDGVQNLAEQGTGMKPHFNEISPAEETRRMQFFLCDFDQSGPAEIIVIEESVAAETVQTVQFKVKLKTRHSEEPLQPVGAHFFNIHEHHMTTNKGKDGFRLYAGKSEATHDIPGNALPFPDMTVEMNP
jgi:hypothetical protein